MESLREWTPLISLVNLIPTSIQRGLFLHDVNITCIDFVPEFIALGTNVGIVFWYNRKSGKIDKLAIEPFCSITCVKIVSSVEYMVAAGCGTGQVNIFQIQKEHPPDVCLELLIKTKPTERYIVRNLHKSSISCVEWSKNGMKLLSGDKTGVVVLTEFNYQAHACESKEILNEKYEVVQICLHQSNLLISTIYRSVMCMPEPSGKWKVTQIGTKDRKTLNEFGAIFHEYQKELKIINTRSGLRFWVADFKGTVAQTLVFKEAMKAQTFEIPTLNPSKLPTRIPTSFGRLYSYQEKYILSSADDMIFVLNLDELKVEAIATKLRKILDISISKNEILILESPRSLIRLSTVPEYSQNVVFFKNIEFFTPTDNQIVIAEECLESSKNEEDPNTSSLIDHLKRLELFETINEQKYDESILFKSGKTRKETMNNSIVEIGQIPSFEADADRRAVDN